MPHFHALSWNVQGKGFEDIRTSWPCLGMDGFDVIGLQEVGGFSALTQPWKTEDCELDEGWIFYVTNPPLTHHAVSIGFPSRLIPHVDHVRTLSVGICITLQFQGCRQFVISAHLEGLP